MAPRNNDSHLTKIITRIAGCIYVHRLLDIASRRMEYGLYDCDVR